MGSGICKARNVVFPENEARGWKTTSRPTGQKDDQPGSEEYIRY